MADAPKVAGPAAGPAPVAASPIPKPQAQVVPTQVEPPKISGGAGGSVVKAPVLPFRIGGLDSSSQWLKALFYAKYGMGKTYLASTAALVPEMGDILWIDAEKGLMTLRGLPWANQIDFIECLSMTALTAIHQFLIAHVKARDTNDIATLKKYEAMLKSTPDNPLTPDDIVEPKRYHTVVVDSFTEVDKLHYAGLLGVNDNTRLDEELMKGEWDHYNQNLNKMLLFARIFRNLPMHVIFLCAEDWVEDQQKRKKFLPMMTGKLRTTVQGIFDIVGYMAPVTIEVLGPDGKTPAQQEVRRLFIVPSNMWDAKNRISSYKGKWFDNPTMKDIMQAIGLHKPAAQQ